MKDQLISLETAILAKEKGYDQSPYKTDNAYGPEYTDGSNIKLRSSSLFNPDSNTAVAPTQALLQRWLREKYNIHVYIETYFSSIKTITYTIHVVKINTNEDGIVDRIVNSFEEALEKGLFYSLKLIK